MRKYIFICFNLLIWHFGQSQDSPLANGNWVKMNFSENGVYAISYEKMNEMGFDVNNVDPTTIQIFGLPGGMLPQNNDADWPSGLAEIPTQLDAQDSDKFEPGDRILFYVDAVDRLTYDEIKGIYQVEKNLYSNHISYFITLGQNEGRKLSLSPNLGGNFATFNTHETIISHEEESINLLNSGREWFGERMTNNALNFQHDVFEPRGDGKLYLRAISQAIQATSLNFNIEDQEGTLNFNPIPNQQYGIKANVQDLIIPFEVISNQITLELEYDRGGVNNAVSYLDKYLISIPTANTYNEDFLLINSASLGNSISSFQIESDVELSIWNITNSLSPVIQEFDQNGRTHQFSTFTESLQKFWVFNEEQLPEPKDFEQISNQNLSGEASPDLIIVANDQFLGHAQQMAEFRRSNDQMSVIVASLDQVYNEFSGGRPDISAIRDFAKTKYDQSSRLKYLLLFGKGSYDYKDRVSSNTNLVPTYESRNSIHPLFTFSSDDYFGFLEDHEGEWIESRAGDHDLEIGIGRIPVTNTEQADNFIEKWLSYQSDPNTFGEWRTKLNFVADDGDRNIHQRDADILARTVDANHEDFGVTKLYLDAFPQEQLPNGEASPEAEKALLDAVNEGRIMINFTGHGAESGWMQERILTFDLMEQWQNPDRLPFLVTATCEFGRNDDPETFSGAEFLLTKERSGAIGLVTTARPVFSSTNFSLNEALYDIMLAKDSDQFNRLGDIIQYTKNNSLEGSLNRNFILLGDPSLRLAFPEMDIVISSINNQPIRGSDTLRAYQTVSFQGQISNSPSFNGELSYQLIDKAIQKVTLGSDSDPFHFEEKDQFLARGKAKVTNGTFSIRLTIPKNIDYNFGKARLQMYALDATKKQDAFGAFEEFILGGTDSQAQEDNSPPSGQLFLNDTIGTVQSSYGANVNFIAILEDENGINISENGLGQSIELIVNDSLRYILNENFVTFPDQFERGILSYPLQGLSPGVNNIQLSYWDNRGNRSVSDLAFSVNENSSLINEIKNYPNPLENETIFYISHQLNSEFVEVKVEIMNMNGQKITEFKQDFSNAQSKLNIEWDMNEDLGYQLEKGVYIYNVLISSKTSGLSESKQKKLIISY